MKINYYSASLSEIKHLWHDIIKIVTIRDFSDNLSRLKSLSKKDAICIYAYDNSANRLVGIVVFTKLLDKSEDTLLKLKELNIHQDDVIQNALIFVDQSYTGLKIATKLFELRHEIGTNLGFKYVVTTQFEANAGRDWQAKKLNTYYKDDKIIIVKLGEYQ